MEEVKKVTKRPEFLSILCIFSFIGLGWRILHSAGIAVAGFFTSIVSPIVNEVLHDLETDLEPMPPPVHDIFQTVQRLMEHISAIGIMRIMFSVFALAGVILMWNQRKEGFYIYTVFRILILFVPVIILGFNLISFIMISSGILFTVIFIVLYGLNLNVMK